MVVALFGCGRRSLELLLTLRRETAGRELALARVELLAGRLRELAGAALVLELPRGGLLLELPAVVRRELALRLRLEPALARLLIELAGRGGSNWPWFGCSGNDPGPACENWPCPEGSNGPEGAN